MSILIKGMEMPKNCDKCGFQSASRFCNAMSYNFCERTDDIGRPDWCPLIEVHTPHGRLIDADELKSKFRHGNGDDDADSAWISTIRRFITQADTIIEAEGTE